MHEQWLAECWKLAHALWRRWHIVMQVNLQKGRRKSARLMSGGVVRGWSPAGVKRLSFGYPPPWWSKLRTNDQYCSLDHLFLLVIGDLNKRHQFEQKISSNSYAIDGDFSGPPTHRQVRRGAGSGRLNRNKAVTLVPMTTSCMKPVH